MFGGNPATRSCVALHTLYDSGSGGSETETRQTGTDEWSADPKSRNRPRFGRMSESRLNWRATLVILALLVAVLCAFVFYRIETWPSRTAHQVSKAFAEVAHLQPRITIRNRVFFEQTTSVLELAVVS